MRFLLFILLNLFICPLAAAFYDSTNLVSVDTISNRQSILTENSDSVHASELKEVVISANKNYIHLNGNNLTVDIISVH